MPQVIVTASRSTGRDDGAVTMREWVNLTDFESGHFVTQLVERLAWAVGDADDVDVALAPDAGPHATAR